VKKVTELLEKASATLEASPTKSLPPPKLPKIPGILTLSDKELQSFWKDTMKLPDYSKILPQVKSSLESPSFPKSNTINLLQSAEKLLSSALSEREESEISEQVNTYEMWDKLRVEELEKQERRFRTHQIVEQVDEKKKELKEKEEVIFFFDHEEEWMMKLPADEQKGYKLDTTYRPTNLTKFVKTIPLKKNRKKKNKT
jgi:hypothetical protein